MKITAAQADELLARAWFEDYAGEVELYEEPVTVDEFDVAARCDELGDTEMVLFGGGLTVHGTLDLGEEVHSIYAVRGHLRARRLILGDAILVVDGTVEIGEWIVGGQTEGLFEVGGLQIESGPDAMLVNIQAPVVAMYDRGRARWCSARTASCARPGSWWRGRSTTSTPTRDPSRCSATGCGNCSWPANRSSADPGAGSLGWRDGSA